MAKLEASSNILRDTFGIIDPVTMEVYEDILSSFLVTGYITSYLLKNPEVKDRNGLVYPLHMNAALRRQLKADGEAKVIISYQVRTTGRIALARIHRDDRARKIEKREFHRAINRTEELEQQS